MLMSTKAWRAANKDRIRQLRRTWRAENPERDAASVARRYAKLKVERPWVVAFRAARCRAAKKNIPFNLDEEWMRSKWTGFCAITGVPFVAAFERYGARGPHAYSPSLDQIIPGGGYTKGNVRIVLWCVNAFKGQMADREAQVVALALYKGLRYMSKKGVNL